MSSPAPKQAESEFDDLLGQLVDELAMTPPSQSGVSLVPDPEPPARVESTNAMAAEAAVAAGAMAPAKADNTLVKVVGIIAGSLTAVAVAALFVFGASEPETVAAAPAQIEDDSAEQQRLAEAAATQREAVERARMQAMVAERAKIDAEYVRVEAARLEAKAEEQAKKNRKPTRRTPKPNKPTKHGTDFDML